VDLKSYTYYTCIGSLISAQKDPGSPGKVAWFEF